jgi:hypothetical protein
MEWATRSRGIMDFEPVQMLQGEEVVQRIEPSQSSSCFLY